MAAIMSLSFATSFITLSSNFLMFFMFLTVAVSRLSPETT